MIELPGAVGIECTDRVVRAVLLDSNGTLPAHAVEVSLESARDDRSVLDAFVRLRAELGGPRLPARIAVFPPGSSMHRVDVTGATGPELNGVRTDIARRLGIVSTVLVDDGPRRWIYALSWAVDRVRQFEALAERAGFLDVEVEPSPIALARALPADASYVERAASSGEKFVATIDAGVPVAAAATDPVGAQHPAVALGVQPFSVPMFDALVDSAAINEQLLAVGAAQPEVRRPTDDADWSLAVESAAYPAFPPHDLRSPERQCVALGAAIGAAGIGGRHRPVDIIASSVADDALAHRPWAIERVSTVKTAAPAPTPRATQRALSRFRPRRR